MAVKLPSATRTCSRVWGGGRSADDAAVFGLDQGIATVEGGLRGEGPNTGSGVGELGARRARGGCAAPAGCDAAARRRPARARRPASPGWRARDGCAAGRGPPARPPSGPWTASAMRRRAAATASSSAATSGTIRRAASVGVEARTSATRSSRGASCSCPIALTTGVAARGDGTDQGFFGERQKVFDRPASAGDHDDVDLAGRRRARGAPW